MENRIGKLPDYHLRPQNVDFNPIWFLIQGTIKKILYLRYVSKTEWSDRFHDIYKLCIAHPGNSPLNY